MEWTRVSLLLCKCIKKILDLREKMGRLGTLNNIRDDLHQEP